MRCITPLEVTELFGKDGFSVNANPALWRFALELKDELHRRQQRVEGRPPPDVAQLTYFAQELNRWLPTGRHRLLWLSSWDDGLANGHEIFVAARAGLGESRPLLEAPGHYFDAHDYDNQDQVEMPRDQYREVGLVAGLASLVMINGWDGWLIAQGCTDRIEFWERNLFFYAHEASRLAQAEALMKNFDCPRELV